MSNIFTNLQIVFSIFVIYYIYYAYYQLRVKCEERIGGQITSWIFYMPYSKVTLNIHIEVNLSKKGKTNSTSISSSSFANVITECSYLNLINANLVEVDSIPHLLRLFRWTLLKICMRRLLSRSSDSWRSLLAKALRPFGSRLPPPPPGGSSRPFVGSLKKNEE